MAERCGSFPLMNLAQDYGVDYGDVLLASSAHIPALEGRNLKEALKAGERVEVSLAQRGLAAHTFWSRLAEHTRKRWAPPAKRTYYARVSVAVEASCELDAREKVEKFIAAAEAELGPACEDYMATIVSMRD